jgi:hypothetical protein
MSIDFSDLRAKWALKYEPTKDGCEADRFTHVYKERLS